jgi:hypothetical protein
MSAPKADNGLVPTSCDYRAKFIAASLVQIHSTKNENLKNPTGMFRLGFQEWD